jgi:hypothetical protein
MPAHHLPLRPSPPHRQRGAALLIIVVIMVIGAIALFVTALNNSNPQISRDKVTADVLAKAKAALIGYATANGNLPGSLPCPDTNDDGSAELFSGTACPSYIGRLPWKTLDIPELRDGSGEELWYALSSPFRAQTSPAHTINSDTTGTLNVTDVTSGASVASNLVAIVFAPGSALTGPSSPNQSRSSSSTNLCATDGNTEFDNLCATNYLESSNKTSTTNTNFNTGAASSSFNDKAIFITHDQLLAPVEMRIAREAKQCLDNYAAISSNTNHRYPWAVPDTYTSQTGIYNTLFGRIAATPLTTIISVDPTYALTMLNALSTLQNALTSYSANTNATTTSALLSAGQALITASQNAANYSSSSFYDDGYNGYSNITSNSDNAGDAGHDLANGVAGVYVSTVQGYIDNTYSYLNSKGFIDGSMPIYWPSGCVFNSSTYWNNWWQEVFYQVASGNRPGGISGGCTNSCLSISGSGNPNPGSGTYTAAVIVGRAHNASGSPTSDPPTYYLEGINQNDGTSGSCSSPPFPGGKHSSTKNYSTCPMLSQKFVTYRPTDPSYSSVNDLVLCLDGQNNCK